MESINLKNFNINKFTLFKMINHNTLKIKFKEKIKIKSNRLSKILYRFKK